MICPVVSFYEDNVDKAIYWRFSNCRRYYLLCRELVRWNLFLSSFRPFLACLVWFACWKNYRSNAMQPSSLFSFRRVMHQWLAIFSYCLWLHNHCSARHAAFQFIMEHTGTVGCASFVHPTPCAVVSGGYFLSCSLDEWIDWFPLLGVAEPCWCKQTVAIRVWINRNGTAPGVSAALKCFETATDSKPSPSEDPQHRHGQTDHRHSPVSAGVGAR